MLYFLLSSGVWPLCNCNDTGQGSEVKILLIKNTLVLEATAITWCLSVCVTLHVHKFMAFKSYATQ